MEKKNAAVFNLKEAATYLGISVPTLAVLLRSGEIPFSLGRKYSGRFDSQRGGSSPVYHAGILVWRRYRPDGPAVPGVWINAREMGAGRLPNRHSG